MDEAVAIGVASGVALALAVSLGVAAAGMGPMAGGSGMMGMGGMMGMDGMSAQGMRQMHEECLAAMQARDEAAPADSGEPGGGESP